jgi:HPt (histidine-containing phosphotransfer) domain-containing protein
MADQWFADLEGEEDISGARKMFSLLTKDVGTRLIAVDQKEGGPEAITREIHALRGAIGSIGLAACAVDLHELEKNWTTLTPDQRTTLLASARKAFQAGVIALVSRFPYLAR